MKLENTKMPSPKHIHKEILAWYKNHGRKTLPWRNTNDPYHIYLSEIMLQQTQVKTVLERFYFQFLEKFPSLEHLSCNSEQDVLNAWQGLGYYTRARNLYKTAKLTAPSLPDTVDELLRLPGIGKNTAHAICAFAFRQPVPIMEANLKRILCRFYAMETPSEKELWDKAEILLNKENAFDYNQAMMDIGSLICTVKQPQCSLCPLSSGCKGKHTPEKYPQKKKKKKIPEKYIHTFVFENNGHYLMQKRQTNFLNGMYSFVECDDTESTKTLESAPNARLISKEISQTYSHFKTITSVHHVSLGDRNLLPKQLHNTPLEWIHSTDLEKKIVPVSGIERKILHLLHN